jgi:propanol-preferring alcohol dehydrogenase
MSRTYKAVQVTKPGKLEVVERTIVEPAVGQVRIRVEACGVCHTDAYTVEGGFPGLTFPRVPGHEVIGKIEALGPGVQVWKEGQRVSEPKTKNTRSLEHGYIALQTCYNG